ncbi:hypothetical protein BFL38_07605 [Brachyspira hampsonii]|uniref:Uncharacterized protein n=2 Tax=Brachyspira TaxID=29521 RepID=A0A1E5NEU8_9SPIR|nr:MULTISPECIES: hypothetical protein [Brachyspira]OEJ14700.1 hypothetical protein BFL38_07605 [Brachyspira hampsonii]PPS21281.1 hypothetical protein DJ52_11820 [Brachyspira murdochii]
MNIDKEKKLLEITFKYKSKLSRKKFNSIIGICYSNIINKQINDEINGYIIPTVNSIVKNYGHKYEKQ